MKISSLIRKLNFWQLFKISGVVFLKPLYILPTFKATRKTMIICDSLYGKTHHQNGKANAFRHALWNVLICQNTFRISKNETKSILWAEKITTLHEKLAPNDSIPKAMDLHNNKVGRVYFKQLNSVTENEIIRFLKEKTNTAKLIKNIEEIKMSVNELVYLSK